MKEKEIEMVFDQQRATSFIFDILDAPDCWTAETMTSRLTFDFTAVDGWQLKLDLLKRLIVPERLFNILLFHLESEAYREQKEEVE